MTEEDVKKLEDAYNKAFAGACNPETAICSVPGVGFVVMSKSDGIFVNEVPATDEQIAKVKEFFKCA